MGFFAIAGAIVKFLVMLIPVVIVTVSLFWYLMLTECSERDCVSPSRRAGPGSGAVHRAVQAHGLPSRPFGLSIPDAYASFTLLRTLRAGRLQRSSFAAGDARRAALWLTCGPLSACLYSRFA